MKRLLPVGCLLCVGFVAVLATRGENAAGPDENARAAAIKLFNSLTPEQKKLALKDINDKERYKEQFPEVKRDGLPYAMLTAEQKTLIDDVIRAVTSEYGSKICLEVGKQSSDKGRYLNFFGEPGPNKAFAWRIAMHHLTLLYAEFGAEKANEFGPVLLGGNPVKNLWDEEDKIAMEFFAALSEKEQKDIQGKGGQGSGGAVGKNGLRIGDLGDKGKALAKKLLQKRMEFFAADYRKSMDSIIQQDGGVDNLRVIFWGKANKSFHDGNSYHWRIGNNRLVCDWQTVDSKHLHLTVRAKAKG